MSDSQQIAMLKHLLAEARAEVERLTATITRVEVAYGVIYGTRHAEPPMDATECAVLLRNALAEEKE